MERVTIRRLRNEGGKVVDRVLRGEAFVVTRDGRPVAELRPLVGAGPSAERLVEMWKRLPPVDPEALRRDVDAIVDQSL